MTPQAASGAHPSPACGWPGAAGSGEGRWAAAAGATAIIQPGGSINDKDVIAAADDTGLAMVFTGVRHFRH
ncbi:MAG: hypothetical protein HYS06_09790 [Methylocystis sp.]|nr:hypothetical protein [Methylocystis sp.]MBI3275667.1 hypothetical protein [Methylocystis sp.]